MTVQALARDLELETLAMPDPDAEITGGYAGDLLSWVMGRAKAGDVWVTIMTNVNIVAVATLSGAAAVLIAENAEIETAVIEKARAQGINLLRSPLPIFELVGKISRKI